MSSRVSQEDATKLYRLECPQCAGRLDLHPLLQSDRGETERIVDEVLICPSCRVSWTLKSVTESLIEG